MRNISKKNVSDFKNLKDSSKIQKIFENHQIL